MQAKAARPRLLLFLLLLLSADGAGAGAGKGDNESGPPQQKKAKHEEAGIAPNDTARLLSVIESNALNDQSVSSRIQ